jgi:hypothetical protein
MSKLELGMNGRDTQLSREKQRKVEKMQMMMLSLGIMINFLFPLMNKCY